VYVCVGIFITPAPALPQSHARALALLLRRIQYCCCWAVGAGDVSVLDLRLRTQACTSRSSPTRASDLGTPSTHSDQTSPIRSFLAITFLPPAINRCPLHALSPPAFALAPVTAHLGKLHSLNCWTPALQPRSLSSQTRASWHAHHTLLSITCRASRSAASIPENIVFHRAPCRRRSVSARLFPASSPSAV
jgi:hypothetical protein